MKKNNRGISTLVFILIFAFIALIVIVGMQSRLLLSIRRAGSTYDQVISIYSAESKLTDIVSRLAQGYEIEAPEEEGIYFEEELPDGTKILMEYRIAEDGQGYFDIIAQRNLASRRIGAGYFDTVVSGEIGEAQVTIALDCTGSMNADACRSGDDSCPYSDRVDAMEQAMKDFVMAVRDSNLPIKIGIAAFSGRTNWIHTDPVNQTGTLITPTNGVSYDEILNAIDAGFVDVDSNSVNTSPICQNYPGPGGTNLGNPLGFFHDYYKTQPSTVQKFEILVTDGIATSRTPYDGCPPQNPGDETCLGTDPDPGFNKCVNEGIRFLECTITDNEIGGVKPLDVNVYSLSIGFDNRGTANRVRDILREHSENYYDMETASELPSALDSVQQEVEEQVTRTIKLFK